MYHISLWQAMKCVFFENLSTMTKIESLPFFNLGKSKTKLIKIFIQGLIDIGNDVYKPYE